MLLVYWKIMIIFNTYEFEKFNDVGLIVLLVVGLFQLFQNPKKLWFQKNPIF